MALRYEQKNKECKEQKKAKIDISKQGESKGKGHYKPYPRVTSSILGINNTANILIISINSNISIGPLESKLILWS